MVVIAEEEEETEAGTSTKAIVGGWVSAQTTIEEVRGT
jgi:hypothetical protein